ncbi:MAG: creatininase family protein, partial [bacterium]
VDGDPTRCGYNRTQIDHCLKNIAEKGVHQESAGVQHLKFLLHQKGKILLSAGERKKLKAHPEILKLRIDSENSPFQGIPAEIRRSLFEILLSHAEGAVKKEGRSWHEIDPFQDPEFPEPYRFENYSI